MRHPTPKQPHETRAGSYPRVSEDEPTGFSIPEQARANEAHINGRGYQFVGHFAEDYTGTVSSRPELDRLLSLARAGQLDVIVCTVIDRRARGAEIHYAVKRAFAEYGVTWEFAHQTFTSDPFGEFVEGMFQELSGLDRKQILMRTRAGKIGKARQRAVDPNGRAPLGIRIISTAEARLLPEFHGRDGERLVDEDEAQTVAAIFERCAEGWSLRRIAAWLEEAGIRTKRGGSTWSAQSIRAIITNPAYTGNAAYNRTQSRSIDAKTPSGRIRSIETDLPPEEWIPIHSPQLISPDLWDRANAALARNKQGYRPRLLPAKATSPLLGRVFCALCSGAKGLPLRCGLGQRHGERRYFQCQSYRRDDLPRCHTRACADQLEALAMDALHHIATPGELAAERRALAAAQRAQLLATAESPTALKSDLADCDRREQQVADLITAGIAEHIWRARLETIHAARARLTTQLRDAELAAAHLPDPAAIAKDAEATQREIAALLATGPEGVRAALQRLRIIIGKGLETDIHIGD